MKKHLFNDVLDLVMTERKNGVESLGTAEWERRIMKRTLEYFNGVYVEDIDDIRLNRYYSHIRYKDNGGIYSDKYIKSVTCVVKAAMRKSVVKGYIDKSLFDYDFKTPKGYVNAPTERLISERDLRRLLACCENDNTFRVIIPTLLMTGMRIGELLALYWNDIDFESNIISVSKAVHPRFVELPTGEIKRDGVYIGKPKSVSSIRDIPITDEIAELLCEWRMNIQSSSAWTEKIRACKNEHLVFPNKLGRITNYETLSDNLEYFLDKNGLKHCNILFHKLRHNYATFLLECGVDIDIISKLLGHKSITTTANTYIKVKTNEKKQAIDRLARYMSDKELSAVAAERAYYG